MGWDHDVARVEARPGAARRTGTMTVAVTVGVVAGVAIAAGITGELWVFEVLAAAGVLVGLGVAFGALDRQPRRRRPVGSDAPPELHAEVQRRLATLDPVEHQRFDLGDPWPTVVVGPTGVHVVSPSASATGPAATRLAEVVDEIHTLLQGAERSTLPVRGILVVGEEGARPPAAPGVRAVRGDQLLDAMARGSLAPMSEVVATFARLTGELAPDLRRVS